MTCDWQSTLEQLHEVLHVVRCILNLSAFPCAQNVFAPHWRSFQHFHRSLSIGESAVPTLVVQQRIDARPLAG